jgi:hypothetical protein
MTGVRETERIPEREAAGRPRLRRLYDSPAGLVASVVLVAGIVATGIFLATTGGGSSPAPPSAVPLPPASAAAPGAAPEPSDTDQTVPTTPPQGIGWFDYEGVLLPYSKTAGPVVVDGPVARGYAHTPLGALLAAEQIDVRNVVSPDGSWRQVADTQLTPGPGQEQWIALRNTVDDAPPAGGYGQPAGFRFVTYDPDQAVLQLVARFSTGALQVTTVSVRWSDEDWKLQLQPDGSDSPTAQAVPSLDGFVAWGATS